MSLMNRPNNNPMNRNEIYSKLGIGGQGDLHHEFDPNFIDQNAGLYKNKVELADAQIPALEKMKEKNVFYVIN